ncbi:HAD family hydrolase [Clostridium formicaceticum]|uniref:Mannosyl-3-phosphoglycerate phosphatase n=1 Tax=Clostridium formicaceticum TaxID=1497 RepID=A0AAC9RP92_9CLOT|nr:HAD hydrolase family protein [Clostridium formicaceticum]AOY74814.1 hypothetical protein BJL90_01880 [Clostridium formicaceticum]ARE89207.1 mannosyl-3-phosphoglycerate phosphatase [Clostridium formicaceticum]
MLFTCDLDETLIYGARFLQDENCLTKTKVRLIETKDGREISYMTEEAISRLKALSKKILFVPVTTRTIEQYKRITLFQKEIFPRYAIVSNGGTLLIGGKVDETWEALVKEKVRKNCLSYEEVLLKFKEIYSADWVVSQRRADDLFYYFIVRQDCLPKEKLDSFMDWLKENHWNAYLQRRKLYFIPSVINKGEAVEYLCDHISPDFITAAGDSLMDLPMLQKADYSITPLQGELGRLYQDEDKESKIKITSDTGILAAEEILKYIEDLNIALEKNWHQVAEETV